MKKRTSIPMLHVCVHADQIIRHASDLLLTLSKKEKDSLRAKECVDGIATHLKRIQALWPK